jgi:hypothetical protein
MSLEEYIPDIDSSESWWNTAEASKESSEKYKESSRKAQAQIQKTKKDEKKAKKYDFLLAGFLVKIIVDKKYDTILESLFPTIHLWYPSNFVLWILSLINLEISNKIREISKKEIVNFNYKSNNINQKFDDNNIDIEIKNRINLWVEDIIDSVTIEYSYIQTKKLKQLLITDENILLDYTSIVFTFFLKELNISITEKQSKNISEFIIWEIKKEIEKLSIENI